MLLNPSFVKRITPQPPNTASERHSCRLSSSTHPSPNKSFLCHLTPLQSGTLIVYATQPSFSKQIISLPFNTTSERYSYRLFHPTHLLPKRIISLPFNATSERYSYRLFHPTHSLSVRITSLPSNTASERYSQRLVLNHPPSVRIISQYFPNFNSLTFHLGITMPQNLSSASYSTFVSLPLLPQ